MADTRKSETSDRSLASGHIRRVGNIFFLVVVVAWMPVATHPQPQRSSTSGKMGWDFYSGLDLHVSFYDCHGIMITSIVYQI